jgi:hypothetical protein
MLVDPYVYGTIFQNGHLSTVWGEIGGYFGVGVVTLALVGSLGAHNRRARLLLAAWSLLALAGSFDLLHARALWNLVPFVDTASVPRYVMPSCELALIILAVLGMNELLHCSRARRHLFFVSLFMIIVVFGGVVAARQLNRGLTLSTGQRVLFVVLGVAPFAVLTILSVLSRLPATSFTVSIVALSLVGESLLWFVIPTIAAPRSISIDYAPIDYLRLHQGEERFLDLSVLHPNWGSQFGLDAVNAIDLPFPATFKEFIQRELYPGVKPANAFTWDRPTGVIAQESELVTHFAAYEGASVKYVLSPSSLVISSELTALGVREVFRDATATIYELPHPRPFFSASSGCHVKSNDVNSAVVTCTRQGSVLRTELSMAGWSANVNGRASTITTINGVYQQVGVPAGTSTVTYGFVPPHEQVALALGLLAGLFLASSLLYERRSTRRPTVNGGGAMIIEELYR